MNEIEWVHLRDVSRKDLAIFVESIAMLDSQFYLNNVSNKQSVYDSILNLLKLPNSDLGNGYVLLNNNQPSGLVCFYAYSEQLMRSMVSIRELMSSLSVENKKKFKSNSIEFSKNKAPITNDCYYLNKILVAEESRHAGIGVQLFNKFLINAKKANLPAQFHVNRNNFNAISFYKRLNFSATKSNHLYQILAEENTL